MSTAEDGRTLGRIVWRHALDSLHLDYRPHVDEWVATATSAGERWEARASSVDNAMIALVKAMPDEVAS